MSAQVPNGLPTLKGAVCYCLDEFSIGKRARSRVQQLRDAVAALAPNYAGLAEVFGQYLLPFRFHTAASRQAIVDHLNTYWFDPSSPTPFFPGVPVAKIYGEGLVQALDLSLAGGGRGVVPLNAWWVVDASQVILISFTNQMGSTTTGPNVTLLIETPRPPKIKGLKPTPPWILGDKAQAYFTRLIGRRVVTRSVRDIR
jgi:hypothetical protein